jgi:hypothetical protein
MAVNADVREASARMAQPDWAVRRFSSCSHWCPPWRLIRAARRTRARFDTLAEARRLGYKLDPAWRIWATLCPGTWHLRKHGVSMWGRLLNPRAPQGLMYWCDSHGRWKLAAYGVDDARLGGPRAGGGRQVG